MADEVVDNEIDLKDLIRSVLDTRVWVAILLVVLSVGYWTLQVLGNIAKPTVFTYQTRINLVFNGVEAGEYPNGSPYNNNDMISPVVLNSVFDVNDMGGFIDRKSFVGGFSVQPFTPDRNLILAKYSGQLEQKNINVAEINSLQSQLSNELNKAASDAVTLTFSSSKADQIPNALLMKVMRDTPKEWARHMVEDIGVTTFNKQIYSEKVIDKALFESIDYLIAFEMLLDRLGLLQNNIDVIKGLPNGLVANDDESGLSVPDLEKAISDIRRYKVAPLINPVRSLGLAKNPELVQLYFENELIELNREIDILKDKKVNVGEAYSSYIRLTPKSESTSKVTANTLPQFETDFLDKIVELTNSGSDIQYRQKLNTELLDVSNKIAEANAEIVRISEILKSMSGNNATTQALRESYSQQVNNEMPAIIEQLRKYFAVSTRLYEKLSRQDLGSSGVMFRMADGEVEDSQSGNILTIANVRLYIIVIFLMVVVVVPVLMVRNAMRKD